MDWFVLLAAGLFECAWAVGLKYSHGFSRLWPSVFTLAAMVASFVLLASATRRLPIGTAYAIWTGIGAVGTALLGILIFREPCSFGRLFCIALILCGVIGLRLCH